MALVDSPSAPPGDRVQRAVERELARRRRLLQLYLLLLLIPLGLAAWFLAAGRSDQEIVQEVVDRRLAPVEERYEQITPKLAQVESLDQALPVVQRAAVQLEEQGRQVETLQQQVREIVPKVQEIQARQADLIRPVEPSREIKELSDRLVAMEKSLATVQERQIQVQRELNSVQRKIDRQPAGAPVHLDEKQLNALIDARLLALERSGRRRTPPQ